ncbi:MAG: hypothetical protein HUK24_07100 [Sphaerochaetaceae bacterium]|nr:hypothetical protein [Sphaerochaetaceae bacterium]
MNKGTKKLFRAFLILILLIITIGGLYVLYMYIDYYRLPDNIALDIKKGASEKEINVGQPYNVMSFNIGFGAYELDYGFFMDGGTESWAFSKERLEENLTRIGDFLKESACDFIFLQEVDECSTRSYKVNEHLYLDSVLHSYDSVFGQNYDSSFLFYPFLQPHGKSKSGLVSYSSFTIEKATRYSLPVEKTIMKFFDLDRCYVKFVVNVSNGKDLVLYNLHLSAYSSDGSIAYEQLDLIIEDMAKEYEKGNYVIATGDFNKDLPGFSNERFGTSYNWAQPIDSAVYEGTGIRQITPYDEDNPVFSCRNADGPYNENQFVCTPDGFLVSENVNVLKANVVDLGFALSDHNPVYMVFQLED